jgi:transposase
MLRLPRFAGQRERVKVEGTKMKTQIHKPSEGKARYTLEYKQEALELWRKSGRSAAKVAAELGIRAPLLYRWARLLRDAAQQGGVSEPKQMSPRVDQLEAEVRRLREENAKLLEQREVLKKSLGILSEPPARGMPKSNA